MRFQIVFFVIAAVMMFYFLIVTRKSALRRLFVFFVFGSGLVFILYPGLSMRIAHLVGIGRGADLVFYVAILFLVFLCFNFYLRFQALEAQLTGIVRTLAITHPVLDDDRRHRSGGEASPPPSA
jgi:hypothetical protein